MPEKLQAGYGQSGEGGQWRGADYSHKPAAF